MLNRTIVSGLPVSCIGALIALLPLTRADAQPLSTQFTFQGELKAAGVPTDGPVDLRFRLYDGAGVQVGPTLCLNDAQVVAGRFTAALNFGQVFDGSFRLLEIDVRPDTGAGCDDPNGFVTLAPRQRLNATPYAILAGDALTLGGLPPSYFTNAANLSSGTISDDRLSTNLPRVNQPNTFLGAITAPSFSGSGAGLTSLNAAAITTGLLAPARGGTGADTSSASVGQVLKWNGSAWTPGTDNAPTYTAGPNLALSGNEFRLAYPILMSGATDSQAIYALNTGTGNGIVGVVTSAADRAGIFGLSTAAGGTGVLGEAAIGTNPVGVLGRSTGSTGRGVFGTASGSAGVGVFASASGVSGAALWATGTGGSLAGRFDGNVQVSGTLRYATPQERWLSISPAELMAFEESGPGNISVTNSLDQTTYIVTIPSGTTSSPSIKAFPLNLPHGATIGSVEFAYSTDSTAYWPVVRILRHNRLNSNTELIGVASGQFAGSGNRTIIAPGTNLAVVDNRNYSYSIGFYGGNSATSGTIRMYGFHVRYFVNDALP